MKSSKILAACIGLFVFVLGSVCATAGPPDHSNGKPPEKFYWVDVFGGPTTYTFDFVDCDDFGTMITITYQGFWVVHPETPGRGQFESYQSITPITICNADDDSICVESIPGSHVTRHWTGVAFETDPIETGVQIMITLPRHGQIFRDVGRLRIDWATGEAVFIAGEWQSWGDDYYALCEALSP